jgi:hypothetical protein
MKAQAVFLISLLLTNLLRAQEPFHITAVAGAETKNTVGQRVRIDPVVEVDDPNNRPIPGATVTFNLPREGPSGKFDNGKKTLTVTTDAQGRATGRGLKVNGQRGSMTIGVVADYQGRKLNLDILETNVRNQSEGPFGLSTKTWVLAGLCVIAIAGGIILAKKLGAGKNQNALTATPGTPVVTGPPK